MIINCIQNIIFIQGVIKTHVHCILKVKNISSKINNYNFNKKSKITKFGKAVFYSFYTVTGS